MDLKSNRDYSDFALMKAEIDFGSLGLTPGMVARLSVNFARCFASFAKPGSSGAYTL